MARGADLANGVIERIAEAHGVTPAQVILRWHIENGTIIIPSPCIPSASVRISICSASR